MILKQNITPMMEDEDDIKYCQELDIV